MKLGRGIDHLAQEKVLLENFTIFSAQRGVYTQGHDALQHWPKRRCGRCLRT
jgi:hypothetical protein